MTNLFKMSAADCTTECIKARTSLVAELIKRGIFDKEEPHTHPWSHWLLKDGEKFFVTFKQEGWDSTRRFMLVISTGAISKYGHGRSRPFERKISILPLNQKRLDKFVNDLPEWVSTALAAGAARREGEAQRNNRRAAFKELASYYEKEFQALDPHMHFERSLEHGCGHGTIKVIYDNGDSFRRELALTVRFEHDDTPKVVRHRFTAYASGVELSTDKMIGMLTGELIVWG